MNKKHLYERLDNPFAVKSLVNIIKTSDMEVVEELYANITRDASNHPRYEAIVKAYNERVNNA
jgi:hypothetical protein